MNEQKIQEIFDVVIIGAGPAGYVCAIKAAQLGMKTAVVEKRNSLGGTCLNVGCIPSKTLLQISEKYHQANSKFEKIGINTGEVSYDLEKIMSFKQKIVFDNAKGIAFLFKKYGVSAFQGKANISAPDKVEIIRKEQQKIQLNCRNIVIATGSAPAELPGIDIDEKTILSSTGALEMKNTPKHLVIIGAGVIGLELGSVWNRLGSKVTCIEFLDRILPGTDDETANSFQKILEKQGFKFKMQHKVVKVENNQNGLSVYLQNQTRQQSQQIIEASHLLVAVGRKPYSKGLGLDKLDIKVDRYGQIVTDEKFQTNIGNIYAIGDVKDGPMLAHKAEDEAVALAENLAGQAGHVNYDVIPSVVYTNPEVATVGKTEQQLEKDNIQYKKGKFNFIANGRAKASGQVQGFVKILSCAKTDQVLGAHIIGTGAGELIAEIVVLMEFKGSSEDLARTTHAHPTMSEAVKEAAMDVLQNPIHS